MFTSRHIPVLLEPVLRVLNPRPGQVIVDCTVGLGGHSAELLRRITPGGRLIGIDFDPSNLTAARAKLEPVGGHFDLFQTNFAALPTVLAQAGVESTNAIIADIGVASTQIDDPSRGVSYRRPGPLDMRMDPTRGQPASALLNRLSEPELADALLELGDETDAPKIARLIGIYAKLLRPETTLTQVFAWLRAVDQTSRSRDEVDWVMFLEEALAFEIPDALASGPDMTTFRHLVELRVGTRRAA